MVRRSGTEALTEGVETMDRSQQSGGSQSGTNQERSGSDLDKDKQGQRSGSQPGSSGGQGSQGGQSGQRSSQQGQGSQSGQGEQQQSGGQRLGSGSGSGSTDGSNQGQ